jgi:hypothetical protein
MKAVIKGNRGYNDGRDPPWSLPADPEQRTVVNFHGWTHGPTIFTLQEGANGLTFNDIRFEHVGIAFSIKASIRDLTVFDSEAYNIRRFLEMPSGIGPTGFDLHDISVIGASKHVFRMRGTANNWAFANITINCGYQTGDDSHTRQGCDSAHSVILVISVSITALKTTAGASGRATGFPPSAITPTSRSREASSPTTATLGLT